MKELSAEDEFELQSIIGSIAMEGKPLSRETIDLLRKAYAGEITHQEALAIVLARARVKR